MSEAVVLKISSLERVGSRMLLRCSLDWKSDRKFSEIVDFMSLNQRVSRMAL
jgi:hypothetical protein